MERVWFSNFIPFRKPMTYQDITFRTPEHFYQAMKTVKSDIETRKKIASAPTPGAAKALGRRLKLRPDWEQIKEQVMLYALRYRFEDRSERERLMRSENEELVEWNMWHDNYWGVCKCGKCKDGKNRLGELIKKVKAEISI